MAEEDTPANLLENEVIRVRMPAAVFQAELVVDQLLLTGTGSGS
jgi:hypothetical protein